MFGCTRTFDRMRPTMFFCTALGCFRWLAVTALVCIPTALPPWAVAADIPEPPENLFGEATRLFFAGKPLESSQLFDRLARARPEIELQLWQRGLALYYADRFADGRQQFEEHRKVNPNDIENATWHFACVARQSGKEAAQKALLVVGQDRRIPLKEVLDFYAGRADSAAVLMAAEVGAQTARRDQLFYAHLYLGLYSESLGEADRAKHHICLAAGPFSMEHYMGRVAQMHAALRGWTPDDK